MKYMVQMTVNPPKDMDPQEWQEILRREKEYGQEFMKNGKFQHIWRIVGEFANVSIFDVESNDELHTILSGFPLFPYMNMEVTALAKHPSALN